MSMGLTMIAQAIAFAIFIWFTVKFVWPPVIRAIENRQKTIADGLAAAESGKQSLANAEKQAQQILAEAKSKAGEIVAQGERQKAKLVEESAGAAKAEGERLLAAAKAEIAQEVSRAKDGLRNQLADLAVAGASRILKREVDAKAHSELLAALRQQL